RTISLKKSCDFCVRRKRHCDGFGRKRCSFCIQKKQAECHYSIRSHATRSGVSSRQTELQRGAAAQHQPWRPPLTGRSFFASEETRDKFVSKKSDDENAPRSSPPPLKRWGVKRSLGRSVPDCSRGSQLSASPATGLVGLQENEFLTDFYECLGFLSLASESTVRSAMVSVMRASVPGRRRAAPRSPSARGAPGDNRLSGGDSPKAPGSRGDEKEGCWKEAFMARGAELPYNSSTCVLWCAIALGALVRGCPFAHVQRYLNLAQYSLAACSGGATLDTARAYLAMAFLLNFLGNPVKNHFYVKLANKIVNALPPGQVLTGIRDVLRYAGKAWVFETGLASSEEIRNYWEVGVPIWKV
ncbi:unnamed protein product, partial [Hapterophycus canaliculatus]